MIVSQRAWHLRVWLIMLPVLVLFIIVGIAARKPRPIQDPHGSRISAGSGNDAMEERGP